MSIGIANISQDASRIGDIKTTIRTDYGDNWLLCNGERLYSDGDYPNLYAITNRGPSGNWEYKTQGLSGMFASSKYLNGYTIVCGRISSSGDYYPNIWYKSGSTYTFTTKQLSTDVITGIVNDIIWTGTYYIACCGGVVYYSTTLSGTWTKVTATSASSANSMLCYGGGYYSLFFHDSSVYYPRVAYSTDLSSWSSYTIYSGDEDILWCTYTGSRWELITRDASGYYHLYYSSTINSGWTRMTTSFTDISNDYKYVSYYDNKYIIGVTNSSKPAIRYSEDFSSWTLQNLSNSSVSESPAFLTYTGQYWCARCYSSLIYSDNLYSTSWTIRSIDDLSPDYSGSSYSWAMSYDSVKEEIILNVTVSDYLDRYAQLPTITYTNAYAYIKAE